MYDQNLIVKGAAILSVDGVSVGWTQGGVRLRVGKELWFRPSFLSVGHTEAVKLSEMVYVSTTIVESTLENLKIAFGLTGTITKLSTGIHQLKLGGSNTINEHVISFVSGFRTAYFYKAIAVDFGELDFNKDKELRIPCNFRILADTTKALGQQLGYIQDDKSQTSDLVLRLNVPKIKTAQLSITVTVYYVTATSNLVARVTVNPALGSSNLISRITVAV